jgi:uncharacterized Zn finger protein
MQPPPDPRDYVLAGIARQGWFQLQPGVNRVGRNPANELHVQDPSVSSFHCEICVSSDRVTIKDLNSTNGTKLDGAAVQECELVPGQIIQFGSAEFRLEHETVRVVIPELKREAPLEQQFFSDSSPACLLHSDLPAEYRCPTCAHFFCAQCVRVLRRPGGKTMVFCSNCSAACERFALPAPQKRKTFLARLSKTLRLPFK